MTESQDTYVLSLQRRIGWIMFALPLLIAGLNVGDLLATQDADSFVEALSHFSVVSLTGMAPLFLWSGLTRQTAGRVVQVALFALGALFSAATSTSGDITSVVFVAISATLYAVYDFHSRRCWIPILVVFGIYLALLAVSYINRATQENDPFISFVAVTFVVVAFSLIAASAARTVLLDHRQERARLAQAVEQRTQELQQSAEHKERLILDLEAALNERNTLMQELHHRSKNNLQLVKSMIDLSESHSDDETVKATLQKSSNRILSIAIVHEQLYKSDRFGEVNLRGYVESLVSALIDSTTIAVDVDAYTIDELVTTIDFAVPLGLILTELISNATEHAQPPQSEELVVTVRITSDQDALQCRVEDNGQVPANGVDFSKPDSMGVSIAEALAAQLGGALSIRSTGDGVIAELSASLGPYRS